MKLIHELVSGWKLTIRKWSVQISIANGTWFTFWTAAYAFGRVPEVLVLPVLIIGGALAFTAAAAANLPQRTIKTVRIDNVETDDQ